MSDYAIGTEKTFHGVVPVSDGDIDAAVEAGNAAAEAQRVAWGTSAPHVIGAFTFGVGWELVERRGEGWFLVFSIKVRVVSVEESTTLPGEWGKDGV